MIADTRGCTGRGRAQGHHGELLQGVFLDRGQPRQALVTLPCPEFWAAAQVELGHGAGPQVVVPTHKAKALRAARLTLEFLGHEGMAAVVTLSGNIAEGSGLGSSTTDVVATIRAVGDALDTVLTAQQITRLAVAAEYAADPAMFDRMVLFAHRDGLVLEDFAARLCPVVALGFQSASDPVDTLGLPLVRHTAEDVAIFARLRRSLAAALRASDIDLLGQVSTRSAELNQRRLPTPGFADLLRVAADHAAGLQVAHSGNVASLLFDPARPGTDSAVAAAARDLAALGIRETCLLNPSHAEPDPVTPAAAQSCPIEDAEQIMLTTPNVGW